MQIRIYRIIFVCIEMLRRYFLLHYHTLMQHDKVAIGEIISFYVAARDELLHNSSAVFATEGGLDIQVCWSCDHHMTSLRGGTSRSHVMSH